MTPEEVKTAELPQVPCLVTTKTEVVENQEKKSVEMAIEPIEIMRAISKACN